jgi:hypothetical protein
MNPASQFNGAGWAGPEPSAGATGQAGFAGLPDAWSRLLFIDTAPHPQLLERLICKLLKLYLLLILLPAVLLPVSY